MKYNCLLFLFFILSISCGSDASQSAFPKRLPVDSRAEHQVDEATILTAQITKSVQAAKDIEELQSNGNLSNYATRDGMADFVAESTTYYKEEGKVTPLKTTIFYLTGDSANAYWLANKIVLLNKDAYQYLFKNSVLIATLKDGTPAEVAENDEESARKTLAIAQKIIRSPIPTNE